MRDKTYSHHCPHRVPSIGLLQSVCRALKLALPKCGQKQYGAMELYRTARVGEAHWKVLLVTARSGATPVYAIRHREFMVIDSG